MADQRQTSSKPAQPKPEKRRSQATDDDAVVTDLRAGDQVAGFGQCLGVRAGQGIQNDAVDRDSRAHKQFFPLHFERSHLLNGSHIQQCVDGRMTTLFNVEQ